MKTKICKRDKSIYKDARKLYGRDGEMNISLRKTHHLKDNKREPKIEVAELVLIKSNDKSKVQWKHGIITEVYLGKDSKVRAVRLRHCTRNEVFH